MRAKIRKIQQLCSELLTALDKQESVETRDMSLSEFKGFLSDKPTAVRYAKQCGIGHSVFLDIIAGKTRPMRDMTKVRILDGLSINIVEGK